MWETLTNTASCQATEGQSEKERMDYKEQFVVVAACATTNEATAETDGV